MGSSQGVTLANVLHRVRLVEDNQTRSTVVLNKLRLDVESAVSRIRELEFSHKSTLREMNRLLQRFGEQMAISRRNEQEKARLTFLHLCEEMEEERNTCKLLQMQNKKLTEDLSHANVAAADACEELNRERKARQLLEEVCNELAREIGEDKAEVEQLKQEQEESRERLENELKMMRMAALWREEKVRNKLVEAKLELQYDGKPTLQLHELRGKQEVCDNAAAVATCSESPLEINKRSDRNKLLTHALERIEHDKCREIEDSMEGVSSSSHLANVPAWLDAHFSEKNLPAKDSQSYKDGSRYMGIETDTTNGTQQRICTNGIRRHRKSRRRQQAQNKGLTGSRGRVYDEQNSGFWEPYCGNSVWPSSEDEPDKRQLVALQNHPLHTSRPILKGDTSSSHKLHGTPNAVIDTTNEMTPRSIERDSSAFSSAAKRAALKKGRPRADHILNDPSGPGSPKKHSSSARFETGHRGFRSEIEAGPSFQHSLSEDDAPSYIASRTERGSNQGEPSVCQSTKGEDSLVGQNPSFNHLHGTTMLRNSAVNIICSADESEQGDFRYEPIRVHIDAPHSKPAYRAIEDDDGINKARSERSFDDGGYDACCGVITRCSQVCKELKVHDKGGCITVLTTQETEVNVAPGQESANRMSPWRSSTGKPLQCLWPSSPDAYSTGTKRPGKASSSARASVEDDGGVHLRLRRHISPAKHSAHQPSGGEKPELLSMRSNSLGAELIKARAGDADKPPKTSFRFSPLRRTTSHG
ncbi:hypothetical protein KP509_23G055900 [Ceratopteris richardii]|uniref:Uncharacterized protein n=1 Tax=Ceratopteris richardii TaxID=49495 RepID=A0A8T2S2H4_CERRI|nr:hypothetical protein KP509_23G055900 [Ceratopteris richardii]KAH7302092.1 hypothetical protein KP509_23G055900 [Ceratopteris richardii]KAH7302093.1 hypothetical protein KP509_23G055900 [Ceratopteris richardii]KAH7302094.1 hypothetical protein KP509_23G055900 [Ceratopteris richardii]